MRGRNDRKRRTFFTLAVSVLIIALGASPASAHGDEQNTPAADLVRIAIAILEVHPSPSAAVDDKIHDAQDATDQTDVDIALVKQAGEALDAGDVAGTKQLLEQSIGECPDNDILYVADQSPTPPCVPPAHSLAVARESVGGKSEVVILIVAALLVVAGALIIGHPYVRGSESTRT